MAARYQAGQSIYTGLFPEHNSRDNVVTSIDLSRRNNVTFQPSVGTKRKLTSVGHVENDGVRASKIIRCSDHEEELEIYRPGSTPSASQHPLLSLNHPSYGLPPKLVENFESLGVKAIYPWQSSCLMRSGVLSQSKNLVYTAPTGGGKSLVADVVMINKVVRSSSKKALLVLPYVALVQEKTKWLRRLVEGLQKDPDDNTSQKVCRATGREVSVVSCYGGIKSKATWADCDVAVCTIEKANMLLNSAIEEGTIDQLGIVVCDELHMIDDAHRGYILELMLTKILTLQSGIQIIGMSATMANPEVIAAWLQAKFFVAKYRPIPIHEHLVYDNAVYPSDSSREFLRADPNKIGASTQIPSHPTHTIQQSTHKELKDPVMNAVVALATEITEEGYGALVFCSSRAATQSIACLIAKTVRHVKPTDEMIEKRIDTIASLQALPSGFEACLNETIPNGVGFHHAGLTTEERDIIAEAYDQGVIKVIVATCSLAAGINLPARRVILNSARMGRDIVGPAMLRQMRGRAGRKGKDEVGETFLCCQKHELEPVAELLEAELPAVMSCLTPEKRGVKRATLEVIATRMISTYEELQEYAENSLLWQTASSHEMVLDMLDTALTALLGDKLIEVTEFDTYTPTPLGAAIVASGLTPEDGLFVHSDLRQAISSFVMDSEMHLFYLFTPIPSVSSTTSSTLDISWVTFRNMLEKLDEPSIRALQLIGINPGLVNRLANNGTDKLPERNVDEVQTARIYRRVYSTFALRDICNETPINTIALKFNLPRGTIQNLAQQCHGFAAGMIKFCQRMATPVSRQLLSDRDSHYPDIQLIGAGTPSRPMTSDGEASGFSMLAAVLEHMQSRLYAGARADLLELTQVTFVKGRMARMLYENGFRSVSALGEADPKRDILPIMMNVSGWKLRQIERQVNAEQNDEKADGPKPNPMSVFELKKKKLEEKLLKKAEIMVKSAGLIFEREVLRTADFEE